MGSGSFTSASYATYNTSLGRDYSFTTGRVTGQTFEAHNMDDSLNFTPAQKNWKYLPIPVW